MTRSISILTYSSLFPNSVQTRLGIFVEERLTHLMRNFAVRSAVVAPVPWFPFHASAFGNYARVARVPREYTRAGTVSGM